MRLGTIGAAALALGLAVPAAAKPKPPMWSWDADLTFQAFHTSDLFPGGATPQPDDGLRLDLRPAIQLRLPGGVRIKPWLRTILERYRTTSDRDLERLGGGVDLRRGAHRLRIYQDVTYDELYFPSSAGGAWLDRHAGGAELRVGLTPAWLAQVAVEREHEDFHPPYGVRDAVRWTYHSGLERAFGSAATANLVWIYRRSDSAGDLYTYDHNALRAAAEWRPRAWTARIEAETALRNYRTPQPFDLNHARQDGRWRVDAGLGRVVAPHVTATLSGEYRRVRSTREIKNADVRSAALALEVTR